MKKKDIQITIWFIVISIIFCFSLIIIFISPSNIKNQSKISKTLNLEEKQAIPDDNDILLMRSSTLPKPNKKNLLRWAFKFQNMTTFL